MNKFLLLIIVSVILMFSACDFFLSGNENPSEQTLNAPTDLQLDGVSSASLEPSIEVIWTDNSDNEEGFIIQRALTADFSDPLRYTAEANTVEYLDKTITPGVTYFYRVQSYKGELRSAWTDNASLSFAYPLPDAPSGLYVDPDSSTSVIIGWVDNSYCETSFIVQYANNSDFTGAHELSVDENVVSLSISGLGTETYYYRVCAANDTGNSAWSSTLIYSLSQELPSDPGSLSASEEDGVVTLSWTDTSDNENGFYIDYSMNSDFSDSQTIEVYANETSAAVNGLDQGENWYFRVAAYNSVGSSGYAAITGPVYVPLPAPTDLQLNGVSSATLEPSIEILWTDNSENEEGFTIQRSMTADFSDPITYSVEADAVEYLDKTITPGIIYFYRVQSYKGEVTSTWTNSASLSFVFPLPDAPSDLYVNPDSSTSVILGWVDNSYCETSFIVQYAKNSAFTGAHELSAEENIVSLSISGLSTETYYYRVCAANDTGNSAWSSTLSYSLSLDLPSDPGSLIAQEENGVVTLNWTDTSDNENGFHIEYSMDSDFSDSQTIEVDGDETSVIINGLDQGEYWYFRVAAYNSVGSSGYAAITGPVYVPLPAPAEPSNLEISKLSETSLNISWTDNSDIETFFELQYGLESDFSDSSSSFLGANVVSTTLSSLTTGETYYLRIRAYNDDNTSQWTSPVLFELDYDLPSAPSALTVSEETIGSLSISWNDNSSNETGFTLEYANNPSFIGSTTINLAANAVSTTLSNLVRGARYYLRICAFNQGGESAWSNTEMAEITPEAPAAPSNLIISQLSTTSAFVSWTDNSDNEEGFTLEYSLYSNFSSTSSLSTSANETGITLSSLITGETYYIRVRAFNEGGDSNWSSMESILVSSLIPEAPSNLAVTAQSYNSLSVGWTDNSNIENGFTLEYARESDFSDASSVDIPSNTSSATVDGLDSSTTYNLRIRAYNENGSSSFSNSAQATTESTEILINVDVSSHDWGAPGSRSIAYACWIEDENGTTLQPLRITSFHFGVSGIGLPIWNRTVSNTGDPNNVGAKTDLDYLNEGSDKDEIDAVTAATVDGDFSISRPPYFDASSVRKFYILFEVDRSYNKNTYFTKDRPAMLYKSPLIDLDNLQSEYTFTLNGWMCNGTVGTSANHDQSPNLSVFSDSFKSTYFDTVEDAAYVWVPEPEYLIDTGERYDDMIYSISAVIDTE